MFTDCQYGFRPRISAEHAALHLYNDILHQLDLKKTPFSIFIDLSKAFDTIDHTLLLRKLEYYGIKNNSFDLFKHYLSNRKQCVHFDDTKSDMTTIYTGVPQGSILGPLLLLCCCVLPLLSWSLRGVPTDP